MMDDLARGEFEQFPPRTLAIGRDEAFRNEHNVLDARSAARVTAKSSLTAPRHASRIFSFSNVERCIAMDPPHVKLRS